MQTALLVVSNARQIFNCQRSDFFFAQAPSRGLLRTAEEIENQLPTNFLLDSHLQISSGLGL